MAEGYKCIRFDAGLIEGKQREAVLRRVQPKEYSFGLYCKIVEYKQEDSLGK